MSNFLQQVVNALSVGSIYALIALGYTMVYGIIGLINFAHGEMYMVGAYIAYLCISVFHLNVYLSLVIAIIGCTALGFVIEKVGYKPLRHSSRIAALITAIGISTFLQYAMMSLMGADIRTYPSDLMNGSVNVVGVLISYKQIFIFIVTIAVLILLHVIVQKTNVGRAMRAVSVDSDAAQLMGINVNRTISFTFMLGSALAGVAGVLVGIYYNTINPLMGQVSGMKAFIAAVVGGIGVIPGAFIGGFAIGGIETLVDANGLSLWKDAVVYGILILILVLRPGGLMGKNSKEKV